MAAEKILDMSMDFAVRVVEVFGKPKSHYAIFDQALRSGTSIGANTRKGYAISVRR